MPPKAVNAAGITRIIFGIAFFTAPAFLLELTSGAEVNSASKLTMRARGIRDVALGVGTNAASRSETNADVRRWLLAGLGCDAVDSATSFLSFRSIGNPEAALVTAAAVGFVALDRWALKSTDEERLDERGVRDS